MAPSGRRGRSRTRAATKARAETRKSHQNQRLPQPKKKGKTMASSNSSTTTCDNIKGSEAERPIDFIAADISSGECCTPKGPKFRIPEIQTCPPAPKKRRLLQSFSLQRSPIAFFAPPDIELFFFSLRDVSA